LIYEHNDILCVRGRLTKFVIFVSKRLANGHTREYVLEPCLDRNRAESTNLAHKRSKDDSFGRYLNTEHNDIVFARGRLTKLSFWSPNVSQRGTLVNLTWNLARTETGLNPPIRLINTQEMVRLEVM